MKWFGITGMVFLTLIITCGSLAFAADAIRIASDEQLFIDEDSIIEKQENITARICPAEKYGPPVLRPDKPWEDGTALIFGSVMFDKEENLFKMWYYAGSAGVAYAASPDGIHWDKPELDVYEHEGQKTNLIAKLWQWDYFREIIGVYKDPRESEPSRRYKMTFLSMQRDYEGPHTNRYRPDKRIGLGIAYSPDGIHFTLHDLFATEEICDISHTFYDPQIDSFVSYGRCLLDKMPPEMLGTQYKRWNEGRAVVHLTSPDMETWSPGEFVYAAERTDPPGTEIYSVSAFPYGGIYICMVQMYYGLQGRLDYQIGYSRNRKDMIRLTPCTPFIAEGNIGDWDRFNISLGDLPPVTVGDEWWFYYGGRTYRHPPYEGPDSLASEKAGETKIYRGQIGLAKVKRGRLLALESSFDNGMVLTRPFLFEGTKLFVNANAAYGKVSIVLRDENNKFIENADAGFTGIDAVDIPVEFENFDLSTLMGKTVKIKFTLENAQWFGFHVE